MVKAVVEFDYRAVEPDELSISKGDVIINIRKISGGWWEGQLNGKVGMFPDNFVREISDEPSGSSSSSSSLGSGAASNAANGKADVVRNGSLSVGKVATLSRPAAPLPSSAAGGAVTGSGSSRKAVVTYPYTPQNVDELQLQIGDLIEITKQEEVGWWEGLLRGKLGVFPSNFVQVLPVESDRESHDGTASAAGVAAAGHQSEANAAAHSTSESLKKTSRSGSSSPALSASTAAGATGVSRTQSKPSAAERPATIVPPSQHTAAHSLHTSVSAPPLYGRMTTTSSAPPVRKRVVKAKVMYPYRAENGDELTLVEGDIITVLDQNLEDAGWWRGQLNGIVGVFPDNFVQVIQEAVEPEPSPAVAAKNKPEPLAAQHDAGLAPPAESPMDPTPPRPVKSSTLGAPQYQQVAAYSQVAPKKEPPPPTAAAISTMPLVPSVLPVKQPSRPVPQPPAMVSPENSKPPSVPLARTDVKPTHSAASGDSRPVPVPATSTTHSSTSASGENSYADELDSVGVTPTLSNVTASRAKNPNRRPPTAQKKDDGGADTSGLGAGRSLVNGHIPAAVARSGSAGRAETYDVPAGSSLASQPPSGGTSVSALAAVTADAVVNSAHDSPDWAASGDAISAAIEELRQEMRELSVSMKKQREMLLSELQLLHESVASMRSNMEQRMSDALAEMAEEKRLREVQQSEIVQLREQVLRERLLPH